MGYIVAIVIAWVIVFVVSHILFYKGSSGWR